MEPYDIRFVLNKETETFEQVSSKTFDILVTHPSRLSEALAVKGDFIVFSNHLAKDPDEWSIIECFSKKSRENALKLLDELQNQVLSGRANGSL
jgi:hypothetical protein